ncbi:MAG: DUF167 domain-containing protein [Burkholderiales bacterium]
MWYRLRAGTLTLTLHAQPGAPRTEVAGLHGDALKVRVAAPAIEDRANSELCSFLARAFAVPRGQVTVAHGAHSRRKVVEVVGAKLAPESLLKT